MRVACFGGAKIKSNDPIYQAMIQVGRLLAQKGIEIVNGGHGGIMEAVLKGAQEFDPESKRIGVPLMFFKPNRFVNCIWRHGQSTSLLHFNNVETPIQCLFFRLAALMSADAFVIAAKGGIGTLLELVALIELNTKIWGKEWFKKSYPRKKIAILVPESVGSWERDILNVFHKHKLLIPEARELIKIARTPEEAVEWVLG